MNDPFQAPTRRQLLAMIGKTAGATAMYQAMTTLGFASESSFKEQMALKGAPAGASIVILGAGLAGEHCSHISAWQEGAILSGMDAATRLHQRAKILG